MIDDLRPYEEYRETGGPLGAIPAHWEATRLGTVGQFLKGTGGNKDDEVDAGVPCIRYGDLYTQYDFFVRKTRAFVTPERAASYTPVQLGDVLFAGSGETLEDIGKSAVVLIDEPTVTGGDVLILRPRRPVVPEFLAYAAGSAYAVRQKAQMGRGVTVKHIYPSELKHLAVAWPPHDEQAAIVRFIDHADRQIRRYISAKQMIIKLLDEERMAIVKAVLLRGMDEAPVRSSGVDWLGVIPTTWSVRRVGQLFAQRNETGYPDLPSLEVSIRTGVRANPPESARNKRAMLDRSKYKLARAGDVAYNVMRMWQGAVGIAPVDGLVSTAYVVATPRPGVDPRFYEFLFRTPEFMREADAHSRGIASFRNRLYWDEFRTIQVPFPPLEVQTRIANHIQERTIQARAAMAVVERELTLLREFRGRLVADVVLGALDVRQAMVPSDAFEGGDAGLDEDWWDGVGNEGDVTGDEEDE